VAPLDAAWLSTTEPMLRNRMGNLVVEDNIEKGTAHALPRQFLHG